MLQSFFNSLRDNITEISSTIAVIALIILGNIAMVKFKQGAIRETLSGLGVIILGILLISASAAIVTMFMAVGATLK